MFTFLLLPKLNDLATVKFGHFFHEAHNNIQGSAV